MENLNNKQYPKETSIKTPETNKKNEGNNPKLPYNDPDQTPEKETQDPPVADPNKNGDLNDPKRKKIGFNKN